MVSDEAKQRALATQLSVNRLLGVVRHYRGRHSTYGPRIGIRLLKKEGYKEAAEGLKLLEYPFQRGANRQLVQRLQ